MAAFGVGVRAAGEPGEGVEHGVGVRDAGGDGVAVELDDLLRELGTLRVGHAHQPRRDPPAGEVHNGPVGVVDGHHDVAVAGQVRDQSGVDGPVREVTGGGEHDGMGAAACLGVGCGGHADLAQGGAARRQPKSGRGVLRRSGFQVGRGSAAWSGRVPDGHHQLAVWLGRIPGIRSFMVD